MMFAPGIDILIQIDSFAIGPGLGVDITQLVARLRLHDRSLGIAKSDAIHPTERIPDPSLQHWNQFLDSDFSLADDNNIGSGIKVFTDIRTGLRAADQSL